MKYKSIVFFDGICNFCNSSVNFIIKRDKKNYFTFSSLQSDFSKDFFKKSNASVNNLKSIILYENNRLFTKSSAALRIIMHLYGFWKIFYIFIIIPPFIRNLLYDLIAKNRYKWFGKRDLCMIPDEKTRNKFLT